jgi:hypothetical protein
MEVNPPVSNVPPGLAEGEQKETAKEHCCCSFGETTDRVSTQSQGGNTDYHAETHNNAAIPTMELRAPLPQRRSKLQRNEEHEQQAGDDMQQRHRRLSREVRIQTREFRSDRERRCSQRYDSARRRGSSDRTQDDQDNPQAAVRPVVVM